MPVGFFTVPMLRALCAVVLFLTQGACAKSVQEHAVRTTLNSTTKATWVGFVAPFELFFSERKKHFKIIADELIEQNIYRLNTGRDNLLIRKTEADDWSAAPDALSTQLLPHFKAINLMGISVANGVIQMGAMGGFPEFNGVTTVLTIDYLHYGRDNEVLCEDSTIESMPQGGYCLWPLDEKNWFAKFVWVDRRDQ